MGWTRCLDKEIINVHSSLADKPLGKRGSRKIILKCEI
jgi:hypothetical protein